MKKTLLMLCGALLTLNVGVYAQRKCGAGQLKASIIARHPEAAQKFEEQRASLQGIANAYKAGKLEHAQRTTAASAIPVIFHIIVDSAEFTRMGGITGIGKRCDSQIAVLNRDYNRQNPDSVQIPSGWMPLYASVGIHFGLAHTDPAGNATPGYELRIITATSGPSAGFTQGLSGDYSSAKHYSTNGLDAWDVTAYMNVWCINFTDDNSLLGITSAKSTVTASWIPANEEGICMNYLTLGKRSSSAEIYPAAGAAGNYFDQGRTLTHECGHFFEIWHTWGDDGGACPWSGGSDDGISDTPPEGDSKFGAPAYTIAGGTYPDACQYNGTANMQPIGIASLDYMNYTDDVVMHMFTTDQAATMAARVAPSGESFSLTQNPGLLSYPAVSNAGTQIITANGSLQIFPNPASSSIYISFDPAMDVLQGISVINILGREMLYIDTKESKKDFYSIDLSAMNKGIYFVRCNFASGIITRKILLQ